MLLCCGISAMASVQYSTDPVKLVSELKKETLDLKKEMLEMYPKFGNVNNINARTVERSADDLSGGTTWEMRCSADIDTDYKMICIYDWYVKKINATTSPSAKKALAEEFVKTKELMGSFAEVLSQGYALENYGGSMATLGYAAGYNKVYGGWWDELKQARRGTMSADETESFIVRFAEWLDSRIKDALEWVDEDEAASFSEYVEEIAGDFKTLYNIAEEGKVKFPSWFDECLDDGEEE